MRSGVGMEQQHNDNGQAVEIGAVVILLAGGLLRRAEQLRPDARTVLLLPLRYFFKGADVLILDRGLPVLDPLGQPEIYEFAVAVCPHHYVVQFDVPVDVALGVQVVQAVHHVQRYLVVLQDLLGLEVPLHAVQAAPVDQSLQVHLAQLGQDKQPDFLVVLQGGAVSQFFAFLALGWLLLKRFLLRIAGGAGAEDNSVGTQGFIEEDHLELRLVLLLLLHHFRALLLAERLQLDPTAMILRDIGVREMRLRLGLREGPFEAIVFLVLCAARLDFDDLGSVYALVEPTPYPVHFRKAAAADLPQILELLREALNTRTRTLSCETFLKSKPSIYNKLCPEPPPHPLK